MAITYTDQPAIRSLLRRKTALVLIVFTLMCIIVWIGLSLYFSSKKTSLSPNVQKQLQPLSPILDIETLKRLNIRRIYTQEELASFEVVREVIADQFGNKTGSTKVVTPSTSPPAVVATTSAISTPSPVVSPSPVSTIIP